MTDVPAEGIFPLVLSVAFAASNGEVPWLALLRLRVLPDKLVGAAGLAEIVM